MASSVRGGRGAEGGPVNQRRSSAAGGRRSGSRFRVHEGLATAIRAVVASDVRLYREGLVERLEPVRPLDVVGSGTDRASTLAAARGLAPDVVLLDPVMTGGIELARGLAPVTKVVVLGVREIEGEVIAWAEAGVSGYVTREASLAEFVEIVESVARGETPCTPRIGAFLLGRVAAAADGRGSRDSAGRLTRRELEVVELIDAGLSNKQIALRLSIELATVKNHVHSILGKLEVSRRAEAAEQVRALALDGAPRC